VESVGLRGARPPAQPDGCELEENVRRFIQDVDLAVLELRASEDRRRAAQYEQRGGGLSLQFNRKGRAGGWALERLAARVGRAQYERVLVFVAGLAP
jgi:hypothetical protein